MKLLLALALLVLSLPLTGQISIIDGLIFSNGIDGRGLSFSTTKTIGNPPIAFNERVWEIQFSEDGREILASTDRIERINWRTKQRQLIWQPGREDSFHRATFSHNGKLFARSNQGDKVHLHEAETGKVLETFEGRAPGHNAIAWSSDDRQVAVGIKGDVVIHDFATGKALRTVNTGKLDVVALEWSPDDKWLAVCTQDQQRRSGEVLLVSLGKEPQRTVIAGTECARFSFSPDSSTLAVACEDGNRDILYLWDIRQAKEIKRIGGGFNHVTHSPDGRLLVAGGLSRLLVLNARTGEEICRRHGDSVNTHFYGLAFSPDGTVLATGIEDRVRFWNTSTWELIDADETLRAPVSALTFTADGRHLITGGWNGDLVLWDWEKKIPVWKQLAEPGQWDIRQLSVDDHSKRIGVVQPTRHPITSWLRLADFESGKTLRYMELSVGNGAPLFHPDRNTAYIPTRNQSISEVDCGTGEVLAVHAIPFLGKIHCDEPVTEMRFDPTDKNVIRWAADTHAMGRLDLKSGKESLLVDASRGHPDANPIPPRDHEHVAIGYRMLNLPTLHEVTRGDNSSSCPHARHPSGLLHFTASSHKVRLFDVMSQQYINEFDLELGSIDAIAISPDGRTLVAGTTGGLKVISLEGAAVETGKTAELWNLMGADDHWMAWQAAWALAQQPDAIAFIGSQLKPAQKPTEAEVARVKSMLSDSDHEVRQTAARQWLDLGFELSNEVHASLREHSQSPKWPHAKQSVFNALPEPVIGYSALTSKPIPPLIPLSEHRRSMRALSLLKTDSGQPAKQLLQKLAQGHPQAPLTKAAAKYLGSSK